DVTREVAVVLRRGEVAGDHQRVQPVLLHESHRTLDARLVLAARKLHLAPPSLAPAATVYDLNPSRQRCVSGGPATHFRDSPPTARYGARSACGGRRDRIREGRGVRHELANVRLFTAP